MKPAELLDVLFKVVMTAAAIKAAMGTIISPMRGKHPIPGRTPRGSYPVELGADLDADLDDIEYEDLL